MKRYSFAVRSLTGCGLQMPQRIFVLFRVAQVTAEDFTCANTHYSVATVELKRVAATVQLQLG